MIHTQDSMHHESARRQAAEVAHHRKKTYIGSEFKLLDKNLERPQFQKELALYKEYPFPKVVEPVIIVPLSKGVHQKLRE